MNSDRCAAGSLASDEIGRKFCDIVGTMAEPVFAVHKSGQFLYANAVAARWFKMTPDGIIGKFMSDLFPKEIATEQMKSILDVITSGQRNERVAQSCLDDKAAWFKTILEPAALRGPDFDSVLAICIDVTQEKELQQALSTSEQVLRASAFDWETTFNSLTDRVTVQDRDFTILKCNKAYADAMGMKPEDIIGKKCYTIMHGTSRPVEGCPHCKTICDNAPRTFVLEDAHAGTTFEITTTPRRGEDDSVVGTVHVVKDITERVHNARLLRKQNDDLEKAIERANEMAVKAELASLAKSQFLATMSHEIRTPLNGVIGMTDLLLETGLSAEQKNMANVIRISGEALLSLIENILDFSKIEAGKMKLDRSEFSIRTVTEDIMDMLAARAHAKGLEFASLVHAGMPETFLGDAVRIRQVLLNLVANAVKFTDHGSVFLDVDCQGVPDQSQTIKIQVSDTGIGISRDDIPKLFSQFTQLDGSHVRKYGGTGLGLAISKRLVDLMGGNIGVESVLGRGSTFWITIALPHGTQAGATTAFRIAKERRMLLTGLGPMENLVLSEYLREAGCLCDKTDSAVSAIEKLDYARLKGEPYHAVMVHDGFSAVELAPMFEWVQRTKKSVSLPVLLVSSIAAKRTPQTPKPEGFSGVVTRPIKRSQLHSCLVSAFPEFFPVSASQAPSCAEESPKPLHVLVAEDNEINQIVIRKTLEGFGCKVDIVENGERAIAALSRSRYQCVFLDLQMPVMDGITAARIIRDPRSRVLDHGVPVVAMTAASSREDQTQCLQAGMNHWLTKPVRREVLMETLGRAVRATGPAQSEPGPVCLDTSDLLDTLDGNRELMADLLGRFSTAIPGSLEALDRAAAFADIPAAKRIMHSIKGSCLNIGAQKMAHAAAAGDGLNARSTVSAVKAVAATIRAEFARLEAELAKQGVLAGQKSEGLKV